MHVWFIFSPIFLCQGGVIEVEDGLRTLRRLILEGNAEGAKEIVTKYESKLSSVSAGI